MVMQANIHQSRAEALLGQGFRPQGRVVAQQGGIDTAELARTVKQLGRHQRLAQVMQQAGHPGFLHQFVTQTQLPRQGDHQRRHRQGMQVVVIASGAQPRQADQGVGMAAQRLADVLDLGLQLRAIQRRAAAHLGEQAGQAFLAARAEF